MPLQFKNGENALSLGLTGEETYEITGIAQIGTGSDVKVKATDSSGKSKEFTTRSRIDTPNEVEYFRHGGILPYVLRQQLGK